MCGHYYSEKLPHTGAFSLALYGCIVTGVPGDDPFLLYSCHIFQWMERKSDGGVVFRSVRAEEMEARRYNSLKQKAMETLFARIQSDFEREENGRNRIIDFKYRLKWNKF